MAMTLYGNEQWSNRPEHTQVYLATHDEADKRLPHRERSFISFSYGKDKNNKRVNIEDFNLIATIRNNSMDRSLYGEFNNNVSTYDVIDGQFFWGSHFTNNVLSLWLSTDEITEKQLQDFKAWFKPGEARELVLAENPNRAIMARVNRTPQYHMLPFEKRITRKLKDQPYVISTTAYRGNIELEFVMDDPFWYSIYNVLPARGQDGAGDQFETLGVSDTNTDIANSLVSNKDYLKIILEDGVPTKDMFMGVNSLITGDESHAGGAAPRAVGNNQNGVKVGDGKAGGYDGNGNYIEGSRLGSVTIRITSSDSGQTAYLYYTGTAPAPTILTFTLSPKIENGYISTPYNKIYNSTFTSNNKNYNKIVVGKQEFQFTTPSIYTGYNQALKIINECSNGESIVDVKTKLIEGVNESYSRAFAISLLLNIVNDAISLSSDNKTAFKNRMKIFLTGKDNSTTAKSATFVFNSKTGEAIGTFQIYESPTATNSTTITENVGDMVYNKYLYLNEKNIYNEDGRITPNECTPVTTDYPGAIDKIDIQYKHMYF